MNRLLAVIGTCVLLVGAVACSSAPTEPRELRPHTERRGPAGAVPPGLAEYYGQALNWGACEPYATTPITRATYEAPGLECARLTVPMDYTRPQGPTITLGLLRRPAGEPSERIGSLVVNPGGPGASGMLSAAGLAMTVAGTDLGRRFDLVGFDPRGVGASRPTVNCLSGAERDSVRLDSDANTSPGAVAQTEQEYRDYVRQCARRSGTKMLAHMGTREVAKDMDVLRSALGDEKLTYLGYSYGTRLGAEYAEQFPGNVRAMLLDGAIDPNQNTVEAMVAQAAGFQRAFESFAAWCAEKELCALGDDQHSAVAKYQELTRPLVREPVPAGKGRELSYSDATTATIQALYDESMWDELNSGLLQLSRGRGRLLMDLADSYFGRTGRGTYSGIMDAFDAVRCVDDSRVTSRARMLAADRQYRKAAPFLDNGYPASGARGPCAFWPVPVTADTVPPDASKLPTTLVISTTGDPATPYAAGARLASVMGSRLLTFEGTQHTVFLQGNRCVDTAGIRYLVELKLPAKGTRCHR